MEEGTAVKGKNKLDEYKKYYDDFLERIDEIIKTYLDVHAGKLYHPKPSEKVIHDPIWGCVKYKKFEIAIIDTPLFQRLRNIYQLGLGSFTYPSARHSRFEHSLGVVAIAAKMIDRLKENQTICTITEYDVNDVRLAALLHDIGHCFYSHLSETYYGNEEEFICLKKYINIKYGVKPKPHEIFSFLIINTQVFKDFLTNNSILENKYIDASVDLDNLMERIGKMIIGVPVEERTENSKKSKRIYAFITRIINGDIDADKLDYIKRDAYTSGLPLSIDIERLLYKMTVIEKSSDKANGDHFFELGVDVAGITAVEEIIFSKLMLNSYIYHHQKVLATEVMAQDVILGLYKLGKIKHACDFLKFTDNDLEAFVNDKSIVFREYECEKNLGYFVKRINHRYLPKRCLEINARVLDPPIFSEVSDKKQEDMIDYVLDLLEEAKEKDEKKQILLDVISDSFGETLEIHKNKDSFNSLSFFRDFQKMSYSKYTADIRMEIWRKVVELYGEFNLIIPQNGIDLFDLHVVIPKTVGMSNIRIPIIYRDSTELSEDLFSYVNNWADAFNSNKWSGYVFASPHIDTTTVFFASQQIFERKLGIKLNEPENLIKRMNPQLLEKMKKSINE